MTKLFISHAAHDTPLVAAVVDLLESGVGVPHKSIFCSSLKGQSIKPGEAFVESIRRNLDDATCVLALISEAYYASAFCMCELGGVWLATKSFLPVLVPPVDYSSLKAVLGGLQVSKIAKEEDLDELRDELGSRLNLVPHPTARWRSKQKAFLTALPDLQKDIEFKGPVAREKFEKLQSELLSYKSEYETLEAKLEEREELISDLKNTKDATLVAKIVRQHSSTGDTFEELVSAAHSALSPLPRAVHEALYYREREEDYTPKDDEDWDAAKRAAENGLLRIDPDDDSVEVNEGNAKVRKAIQALEALDRWLVGPPGDFSEWYENEADGEEPRLTLRTFWKRHLK